MANSTVLDLIVPGLKEFHIILHWPRSLQYHAASTIRPDLTIVASAAGSAGEPFQDHKGSCNKSE